MADNSKKAPKEKKKQSFWKGVKQEWNKIQWPTVDDLKKQTGLVVVISVLMGVCRRHLCPYGRYHYYY